MRDNTKLEIRNRLIRAIVATLLKESKFKYAFIIEVVGDEFFIGEDMLLKNIIPGADDTTQPFNNENFKRELPLRLEKIRDTMNWRTKKEKIKAQSPTLFS